MCLCSELKSTNFEDSRSPNIANLVNRFEEHLSLLHQYVIGNTDLTDKLSFTIKKRVNQTVTRTAKIFKYDPNEHATKTLLKDNFQGWNKNPSTFWTQFQQAPYYETRDPQRTIIYACLQLDYSDAHSCILRRFYCVVLFRLRTILGTVDDATTIATSIYNAFHHEDSEVVSEKELGDLIDTVGVQIEAGSRYENIISRLGIGSLFILGQDIGRSVWEKSLPKSGDLFERAICHLADKGAADRGKHYEQLGESVLNCMINNLLKPGPVARLVQQLPKRSRASTDPRAKRQRNGGFNRRHRQHESVDVHDPYIENLTVDTHENMPQSNCNQRFGSSTFASTRIHETTNPTRSLHVSTPNEPPSSENIADAIDGSILGSHYTALELLTAAAVIAGSQQDEPVSLIETTVLDEENIGWYPEPQVPDIPVIITDQGIPVESIFMNSNYTGTPSESSDWSTFFNAHEDYGYDWGNVTTDWASFYSVFPDGVSAGVH